MSAISSIDWTFLEAFLGDHGKLIVAAIALLVAVSSLIVAILKYLAVKLAQKERDEARLSLQKQLRKVQEQEEELAHKTAELAKKNAALSLTAAIQHDQETALKEREHRLNEVRSAFVGQEHDLWCLNAARPPSGKQYYDTRMLKRQRQKPAILVANLKGGVGKSTLVANLAASFKEAGKRVLIIDADYQGSLSNMLLTADGSDRVSPEINRLLEPGSGLTSFHNACYRFQRKLNGSLIVASTYALAAMENRLMIEYLLGDDRRYDDGRYRLASLLLSEDVGDEYDVALIDAPPRLTAATINGFCAATHLLVPTVYDRMSAEAVGTFLHGVRTLKSALNHQIDLLGVVGTLTQRQDSLAPREQNARNTAMSQVAQVWGANFHVFERHIPRKSTIAEAAGEDIAYYCDATVRGWFDALTGEMSARLWPQAKAQAAQAAQTAPRSARVQRAPRSSAQETAQSAVHPAE
jgi:chromosome partitioning protein